MSTTINNQSSPMEQGDFVSREYFTPAFQAAIKQAQAQEFEPAAIINGSLIAYANLIITMVGPEVGTRMMHDFAMHVAESNNIDLNKPLAEKSN